MKGTHTLDYYTGTMNTEYGRKQAGAGSVDVILVEKLWAIGSPINSDVGKGTLLLGATQT